MSNIPFILNLDPTPYYGHNMFPNQIYRRLHPRHHDMLDFPTLAMIAKLGPHAHHLAAKRNGEMSLLAADKKGFEVNLDVGLFQPDELSVKVVNDYVVVEGKHEEREDDHGHISRHIVRRYKLPKGHDPDAITSTLTTDGVLTVSVPKPAPHEDKGNERIIPIHQTGPSELFLHNSDSKSKNNSIDEPEKK